MTAPHTPGPWLVATSNSWRRIVSARGGTVCEPCAQPDGHPDLHFPNGGADGPDARILVAAPALLSAARAAIAYDDAIQQCANDPDRMSSFCTAEGDTLDTLYEDWISKSRTALFRALGETT